MSIKFSDLLDDLKDEQGKKSWDWYQDQAKRLRQLKRTDVNPEQAINDPEVKKFEGKIFPKQLSGTNTIIGRMILFQYDPKLKDKLPFWDEFPLGFPIDIYNNGYLMLNMHYLPLPQRARLMDD